MLTIPMAGDASWQDSTLVQAAASILLVYVLVFVGVLNVHPPWFLQHGDYSYGIYLYGFPDSAGNHISLPMHQPLVLQLRTHASSTHDVCRIFLAHVIEKPIVSLRRNYSFLMRRLESDTSSLITSINLMRVRKCGSRRADAKHISSNPPHFYHASANNLPKAPGCRREVGRNLVWRSLQADRFNAG
jgi:hypothetical protein